MEYTQLSRCHGKQGKMHLLADIHTGTVKLQKISETIASK